MQEGEYMNCNWSRMELKWRAKDAMRKNYWAVVIVSLILMILTAGSGESAGRGGAASAAQEYRSDMDAMEISQELSDGVHWVLDQVSRSPLSALFALFSVSMMVIFGILAVVFGIFISNVLEVGIRGFFIENMYSNPGVGKILQPFRSGYYWNVVKVMFLKNLFIFLWSLLLVIPGIVKAYEYYMVPYLLAEYPDMSTEEAFTRSKEMMYGNKWNALILDFSFFPWEILSRITFGIAGIFYVNPYVNATKVELYDAIGRTM